MFAMSVSLLNPHAILDTIGVIGTSSLGYTGADKLMFTVATMAVSWIWFFALAFAGKMVGAVDTYGPDIKRNQQAVRLGHLGRGRLHRVEAA